MRATDAPRDATELFDLVCNPSAEVLSVVDGLEGDVLVLGAGGKMGLHLCVMLQRAFHALAKANEVIAVSRFGGEGACDEFDANGIRCVPCDLTSPEAVEGLPDAGTVFFLAGVKFGTSESPELLRQINVEMPALVAERFKSATIVALSTGCVYPFVTVESGGATEETPPDPPGAYAESCLGRERAFSEVAARHGTRVSLIRLNYAVDLRYGVLVDIARAVLSGEPVAVTTGYVNVIWQGDALDNIIEALARASSSPFVLNVTGTQILRVRDLAVRFSRMFSKEVILQGDESKTAWLSSSAKRDAIFGEPSVTEDQLIDWVAAWLEQGGDSLGKPTHFEIRDGNF